MLFGLLWLMLSPVGNKVLLLILFVLLAGACVVFGWKWGLSDAKALSPNAKAPSLLRKRGIASGRVVLVLISLGAIGGALFANASSGKVSDVIAFCLALFFVSPFFSLFSGYYLARARAEG
ncbi:hypothetical protein Pth03_12290 [Planotetraspora thailandica]|uniref:Uncharacterized protein n=1 Tax=Planotetraspora thailandica TaxID=487172 RepID=A0A8J3UY83_9ACTN|nr:hypothetical protein [Planotetraspora thailandica]GII52840.1 hypothetical protein Pth03_12290 [Planotetraspora thailandica]